MVSSRSKLSPKPKKQDTQKRLPLSSTSKKTGQIRKSKESAGKDKSYTSEEEEELQTDEVMDEDVLACGKCSAVFNNIHHFIDHKTSACRSLEGALPDAKDYINDYSEPAYSPQHLPQDQPPQKSSTPRSDTHEKGTPSKRTGKQQTPIPKKVSKSSSDDSDTLENDTLSKLKGKQETPSPKKVSKSSSDELGTITTTTLSKQKGTKQTPSPKKVSKSNLSDLSATSKQKGKEQTSPSKKVSKTGSSVKVSKQKGKQQTPSPQKKISKSSSTVSHASKNFTSSKQKGKLQTPSVKKVSKSSSAVANVTASKQKGKLQTATSKKVSKTNLSISGTTVSKQKGKQQTPLSKKVSKSSLSVTASKQKGKQTPSPKKVSKPSPRVSGNVTSVIASKQKGQQSPSPKKGVNRSTPTTVLPSKQPKTKKVFTVEKILNKRKNKDKIEYLIKWENYPSSENCWEPEENILSKSLIKEFEQNLMLKSPAKKRKSQTFETPDVELKKIKLELVDCSRIPYEQLLKEDEFIMSSQKKLNNQKKDNKDVCKTPKKHQKSEKKHVSVLGQNDCKKISKDESTGQGQVKKKSNNMKDVSKNIKKKQKSTNKCTFMLEQNDCKNISKYDTAQSKEDPLGSVVESGSSVTTSQTNLVEHEQGNTSEGQTRSRRSTSMAARDFIKSVCQKLYHAKSGQKSGEEGKNKVVQKKILEKKSPELENDSDSDSTIFIPKLFPKNADSGYYSNRKYFSFLLNSQRSYFLSRNGKYRGKDHCQDKDRLSRLKSHVSDFYEIVKREPFHGQSGRKVRPKDSVCDRETEKSEEVFNNRQDSKQKVQDVSDSEIELKFSKKTLTPTILGHFESRGRDQMKGKGIGQNDRNKRTSKTEKNKKVDLLKKDKKNGSKSFYSLKKTRGGKLSCNSKKRVGFVEPKVLSGDNLYQLKTIVKKTGRLSRKTTNEDSNALVSQLGLPPHLEGPPPAEEFPGKETPLIQPKNRVFVSLPDKTVVEVSCSDRQKVLMKAESKLKALASSNLNQDCSTIGLPKLEECTLDPSEDSGTSKLPNTVLLIESELPVEEAENKDIFEGVYLFSQVFSPTEKLQKCMICPDKIHLKTVRDLEKHYRKVHDLASTIKKAQYNENHVFVCMPSNVNENTVLKSKCRFCQVLLRNVTQVQEHYSSVHGKVVRNIPESQISFLGRFFYCSMCSYPSSTILSHLDHMKTVHSMKTFVCRHCNFCTPQPYKLRLHVRQSHFATIIDSKCPVCQINFKGELVKHMKQAHAVQTAPSVWSCSKCYSPCEEENELAVHLAQCENSQAVTPTKKPQTDLLGTPSAAMGTVFYKCNCCSLTFTAEEDVKKHMEEGVHLSPGNTEINDTLHSPGKSPGSGTAESTCFVCCMRFSTVDMCHEHQKHVHMRWVDRQLPDHSHEELSVPNDFTEKNTNSSKSSPQLTANPEEKVPTDKESGTPVSSEVEGEDNHGGDETSLLGDSETTVNKIDEKLAVDTTEDVECNFDKCDSQVISENSTDVLKTQQNGLEETTSLEATEESFTQDTLRTNLIVMNDVPSDKQLAELGFPSKVGHYCHLCDTVIQSYPLYYMHMYNVHSLEKRFQCIISDCKHTFSNATAFQCHAQKHNQKSESFCSLCDMVFEDTKSLQDHIFSPQHGEKYIKTQEKYFHSEPRNYRCKVCLTWFGLFAIYVKHMETESHQYRCKYCGLSFVQPGPRRNHIQSVHPEVANVCEICGIKMDSSQALWSHLSGHKIVHECPKCRRRFLQKEQLSAHMEVHDPPVTCPWEGCSKKLSSKMGLYNHMKSHQEKRDFDCSQCGKAFFKKQQLEKHLETHEQQTLNEQVATEICAAAEEKQSVTEESSSLTLEGEQKQSKDRELIQLICATCHKGFDSEDQFAIHVCSGHPK